MGDNHVVAGAIPAIQTSRFTTVLETGRDSAKIDGGGATPPGGALARTIETESTGSARPFLLRSFRPDLGPGRRVV